MESDERVINLDEMRPHRVAETICVQCRKRVVSVWPDGTPLARLVCSGCGMSGFVILTGEPIPDD